MKGAVKTFKCMVGLYPDPVAKTAAFIFFIILVLVGSKLICGWACPTDTAKGLVNKKKLSADCFSCARCLNSCPVDAIKYKLQSRG